MRVLTTLLLLLTAVVPGFAQPRPPKSLEQFQQFIGKPASSVTGTMSSLGFKEREPSYTPKGNFSIRFFVPVTQDNQSVTVHIMNDMIAGITNHSFNSSDYINFVDVLEQKGFVITHQKVQLETSNDKRFDIWRSPDMNNKVYVRYAPQLEGTLSPYEITVTNRDMFYGHIEGEYTGRIYDPRLSHFSQMYANESYKGSMLRLINGQDYATLTFSPQSLRVSPGMRIIAFEKENFRGDSTVFVADQAEMLWSWRNIKSLKVRVLNMWVWFEGYKNPVRLCFGARSDQMKEKVTRIQADPGLILNLYTAARFSGEHTDIIYSKSPLPQKITESYIVNGNGDLHPSADAKKRRLMYRIEELFGGLIGRRVQTMKDKTAIVKSVSVREYYRDRLLQIKISSAEGSDSYESTYTFNPATVRSITEIKNDPAFRKLSFNNFIWDGYVTTTHYENGKYKTSNTSSSYGFEMDFPPIIALRTFTEVLDALKGEFW